MKAIACLLALLSACASPARPHEPPSAAPADPPRAAEQRTAFDWKAPERQPLQATGSPASLPHAEVRGLMVKAMFDAPVTSMILQQGEVVVLTEDYRVFRFRNQRWVRVDAQVGRKSFLLNAIERTGYSIVAVSLLPGPNATPWVATITAFGEDATTAMDNMHLTLYSIGSRGWTEVPLPRKLGLPRPNYGRLNTVDSGPPALCSDGSEGPFCLLYEQQGWRKPKLEAAGALNSIRWVKGELQGIYNNSLVTLRRDDGIETKALPVPELLGFPLQYVGDVTDFWAWTNGNKLIHNQQVVDSPVGEVKAIWAWQPSEVWVGGLDGVAYSEGSTLKRVFGIGGSITKIIGISKDELWFAGSQGVFRATPFVEGTKNLPDMQEPDAIATQIVETIKAGLVVPLAGSALSLSNPGRLPFGDALFAQSRSSTAMTFVNFDGVYSHILGSNRVRSEAKIDGNTVPLGSNLMDGNLSPCTRDITSGGPLAFAPYRNNGEVQAWLRGDIKPELLTCRNQVLTRVRLFDFTVGDLALADSHHVWLAGAKSRVQHGDGQRVWPDGKGVLLDWSEERAVMYTVEQGPLFAVTTSGDTTWAAGANGLVARVQGGKLQLFQLDPKMTFWDALSDTTGVWLVGDGLELRHFDGREQIRYQAKELRSPLTGLARDGEGQLWIVGPSTLYRSSVDANAMNK